MLKKHEKNAKNANPKEAVTTVPVPELQPLCDIKTVSTEEEIARKVGSRHGKPAVYIVKSGEMYRNHARFYRSVNGVWLTEHVSVWYLCKNSGMCISLHIPFNIIYT